MAIVTKQYYESTYMGETIAADDFSRYEARAERLINQITHGRAAHYAALPAFQQQAIQDAICAQMEFYVLMGLDISVTGETSNGWTVGKVHVNGTGKTGTGASSMVSAAAFSMLEQTGLLNPQVATVGDQPMVWMGVL